VVTEQSLREVSNIPRVGIEDAPVFYTNTMNIRPGIYDFDFVIGRLDVKSDGDVVATTVARLIMSPQHAKALSQLLAGSVESYEKVFGPIVTEAEAVSQMKLSANEPAPPSSRSRPAARKRASQR